MLVDSHCHLDRLDLGHFKKTLPQLLEEARQQGILHFLCVAIDLEHFPQVLAIAEQFPDVSASVGIHPTETFYREEMHVADLVTRARHPKVVAIGETGLDYYRDHTPETKKIQQLRFREHIQAALTVKKPLIIHTRQAREDTLSILKEEGAQQVGGVLHCFTEDLAMAEAAIAEGFYISFSGILTFKNAQALQQVAQTIPLDRILIETDAPYLTPDPFRGRANQPAYVRYVAEKLAELRGLSFNEVAEKTTANFYRLFSCQ